MWIYNAIIAIYVALMNVVALWHKKARLWVDGRSGMFERMAEVISPDDKVIWVHVASLGEFEQGRPIIERIRELKPDHKILLTFYSPSGYEIRKNYEGADYVFYIPADLPCRVKRFLDIAHPEITIFVKYEFWLNMLSEMRARSMRVFLVSAIFRSNSVFFRPWGELWRVALDTYETIFVQDEASQQLLSGLGYDNVIVGGDTRFDRVAQIAKNSHKIGLVERFKGNSRLFVAGSTWGPDEEILLDIIESNPDIKFVIAPHEMEQERIASLQSRITHKALRYTEYVERTDDAAVESAQVLILDTVGILSSVYSYAEWAYIGGGFGVGIHNTLEAATFGLPLAFGPNYQRFKEACDMISIGVASSVTDAESLRGWFEPLRDDAALLAEQSMRIREYTVKHQGATEIFVKSVIS